MSAAGLFVVVCVLLLLLFFLLFFLGGWCVFFSFFSFFFFVVEGRGVCFVFFCFYVCFSLSLWFLATRPTP